MQPIVATPPATAPTPSPLEAATPSLRQPTTAGPATAAPGPDAFGALPFAWFFASALQPVPAPASPADLPTEVGEGQEETTSGNVLPLPAALPMVALPLVPPIAEVAPAAEGGSQEAVAPGPAGVAPLTAGLPVPDVALATSRSASGAQPGMPALPASDEGAPLAVAATVPDPAALPGAPEPLEVEDGGGTAEPAVDGDPLVLSGVPRQGPSPAGPAPRAEPGPLTPQVGDPRWAPALGERLVWMVEGDVKHAELRLNPPDLGPLEVRIAMVDDEARITFTAAHPSVREAVEAALPRLRDMLGTSGVNLVQVDVSGQGAGHRPPPETQAGTPEPSQTGGIRSGPREALATLGTTLRREGLFDAYA